MANYQTIMRVRPEYREFTRNRRLIHRGDVVVFARNKQCDSFSTDAGGFRHTRFNGETLSLREILKRERYGLVLGSSHIFGFGLAGNENTLPSLLGERFGFPFANLGLPEGNSRNLSSLLVAFIARAQRAPAVVIHFSGGDFTNFSVSSIADSIFGSPNLKQLQMVLKERGGAPPAGRSFPSLLAFTSLWTQSMALLCRARGIPLVLGNDTTFFEKAKPSAIDEECELGKPFTPMQRRWFATHKAFVQQFYERRESLASALGVPLAGPGKANDLGFIDEFHHDRDGTRALSDDVAAAVTELL